MRPVPDAHWLSRDELVKLVQRVFLLPEQESPRLVMFVGAEAGTGCTSICAGTAEALVAQVGAPVCVVDANLRHPALHQTFSVDSHFGLSDAMLSSEPIRSFIRKVGGDNLWLLPCGSKATRMAGLLSASRLKARFDELRDQFAYVLVDSPAVNTHSDAIRLGQLADAVIMVLESNSTRREVARSARITLESAQIPVLGAILNKRTFPIPQFIYNWF
jgi:polysaccharide biosynthesis transport protein